VSDKAPIPAIVEALHLKIHQQCSPYPACPAGT
jgi:hypothetical protein